MLTSVNQKHIVNTETKILFSEKLTYISEFLNDISSNFENRKETLEDSYLVSIGCDMFDLNKDDFEFHNHQIELLKEKYNSLPQILYKSLIVSIYSIIETTICELIISIEKSVLRKIKYKYLKSEGSEIENSIRFLNLVYDLNFNSMKPILEKLKQYSSIRNNIVHRNGNFKDETERRKNIIKKFMTKEKTITINNKNKLIIKDKKFILDFLKIAESFGFKLFEIIKINESIKLTQ